MLKVLGQVHTHEHTHARARTHTQRLLCRPNSYKHTMTTDIHQRQWDISVNSRFRLLVHSQQSKQLAFFSFFFSSGVRSLPERRIRVGAKNVCLTFPWFTTAGLHAVHQTRTLRALRQPSYLCEVTWRTPAFLLNVATGRCVGPSAVSLESRCPVRWEVQQLYSSSAPLCHTLLLTHFLLLGSQAPIKMPTSRQVSVNQSSRSASFRSKQAKRLAATELTLTAKQFHVSVGCFLSETLDYLTVRLGHITHSQIHLKHRVQFEFLMSCTNGYDNLANTGRFFFKMSRLIWFSDNFPLVIFIYF